MNNEFKGSSGEFKLYSFPSEMVSKRLYSRTAFSPIHSHEVFSAYGGTQEIADANAVLLSKAPEMLEMLRKAHIELGRIRRSVSVHPDCTEGSEFDNYTTSAQETEDQIENLIKEATCTSK